MPNPARKKGAPSNRITHHVGMIGEGRFITWAAGNGWDIFRSLDGHAPYDYVVDTGQELLRVEVKCVLSVQNPPTARGRFYVAMTKFNKSKFDYVFLATPDGNYWIPRKDCPTGSLNIKKPGTGNGVSKWEGWRVEQSE